MLGDTGQGVCLGQHLCSVIILCLSYAHLPTETGDRGLLSFSVIPFCKDGPQFPEKEISLLQNLQKAGGQFIPQRYGERIIMACFGK